MRVVLPSKLLSLCLTTVLALLLAGCGFQLRGSYSLPYESLYLAMPDYSVVGADLKRAIRSSGTTLLALNSKYYRQLSAAYAKAPDEPEAASA